MSKAEPYYIVALREPGSKEPARGYVICKTVSVVEHKAGQEASSPPHNIATYLDEQFAHAAADKRFEAVGWEGNVPILDGSKSTALFLGTADQD